MCASLLLAGADEGLSHSLDNSLHSPFIFRARTMSTAVVEHLMASSSSPTIALNQKSCHFTMHSGTHIACSEFLSRLQLLEIKSMHKYSCQHLFIIQPITNSVDLILLRVTWSVLAKRMKRETSTSVHCTIPTSCYSVLRVQRAVYIMIFSLDVLQFLVYFRTHDTRLSLFLFSTHKKQTFLLLFTPTNILCIFSTTLYCTESLPFHEAAHENLSKSICCQFFRSLLPLQIQSQVRGCEIGHVLESLKPSTKKLHTHKYREI